MAEPFPADEDAGDEQLAARNADAPNQPLDVVVYESRVLRAPDGGETLLSETGELNEVVAEQVARPWTFRQEPYIYQEEAWELPAEDGGVEQGYRITRTLREKDDPPAPQALSPVFEPGLADLAETAPAEMIRVHIRLRDFPEWDIPPRPTARLAAVFDLEAAATRRAEAMEARQQLAEELAADLVDFVNASGGAVIDVRGSSGWVWAELPAYALKDLAGRADIERVRRPSSDIASTAWRQGDGRWAERMNADTYLASGWNGEIANPNRHVFPRLIGAVIEAASPNPVSGFEDEACAFYDGANCSGTSRILARYKCDLGGANPCHFVLGFPEAEEGNHGTAVAAAVLGDYTDGQGCGKSLNDPAWASGCHGSDWELSATGMAPEAYLEYFATWATGWPGSPEASIVDALHFAYAFGDADVINNSYGYSPGCDEDPGNEMQDEVENAFDDGALVVVAAGNVSGPGSSCNIRQPAALVKALAVNAFDAKDPDDCENNYHSWCLVDDTNSARGGMTANVAGVTRTNAITGVDLIAVNEAIRYTSDVGDFGDVTNSTSAGGTSYASPTVAGLALLVKHRMLHYGNTWVNSPGRLQTIMLAMGDRHYSTDPTSKSTPTVQRTSRGDSLYGFGRPALRRFTSGAESPSGWYILTWTTKTATYTNFPFGILPAGTRQVKCVLHQHEDLSGSTSTIADFSLRIRILQPQSGGTCSSAGTQVLSRTDTSFDTKSMVAIEDTVQLAGNCAELQVVPVSADRVTPTNTICYYSGLKDDE